MSEVVVGGLKVKITADGGDLKVELQKAQKRMKGFSKNVQSQSKSMGNAFSSLANMAKLYLGGMAVRQVGMLGEQFVDTAADFEKMKITLISLEKDVKKGLKVFDELDQWAKDQPIRTEEAIRQYIKLQAMGLKPTIKQMQILLDATMALGGSVDTFQGIARAVGQISAKGKIAGEEIRQLAERGVPASEILRKKFGLVAKDFENLAATGITAEQGLAALFEAMEQRFGGTAVAMMNTWVGLMNILFDRWTRFQRSVMDAGIFDWIKGATGVFLNFLDSNWDKIISNFVDGLLQFADFVNKLIRGSLRIIDSISPIFSLVARQMAGIIERFLKLPDWLLVGGIVAGLLVGKKGLPFILGIAHLIDKVAQSVIMFKAIVVDKKLEGKGFWDWFISSPEEWDKMKKQLEEAGVSFNWFMESSDPEKSGLLGKWDKFLEDTKEKAEEYKKIIEDMKFGKINIKQTPLDRMDTAAIAAAKKNASLAQQINDKIRELQIRANILKGYYDGWNEEFLEFLISNKRWEELMYGVTGDVEILRQAYEKFYQAQRTHAEITNTFWNGIKDSMKTYIEQTGNLRKAWESFGSSTLNNVEQGMSDIFMSAMNRFRDLQDVITNMLRSVLQEMIRILIVQRLIRAVAGAFGASSTLPSIDNPGNYIDSGVPNSFGAMKDGGLGGATVNIIDQRTKGSPLDVQETTGPNGERQVTAIIRDTVKGMMSDGSLDRTYQLNYGVSRKGR
jgi:tape measure domain-containing protein